MLIALFWLICGFVFLIKGADFFVEGSSSIAKLLGIPSIIIGLTIVALGTSAPETAVSISAGLAGSNGICVGNVVGSNFFNLLVVVGVCAIIRPIKVTDDIIRRDFPISIAATIILLGFIYIGREFNLGVNDGFGIAGYSGGILLFLFVLYIISLVYASLRDRAICEEYKTLSPFKSIFYIVIGIAGIIIGGQLVVDKAQIIASEFGMSQSLIGLTIVAIGTSLPELVTSIVAAKKGENDMALGNVIGSNIFNILFVLGVSAVVNPIDLSADGVNTFIDITILIIVNVLVYLAVLKNNTLRVKSGLIMILMYLLYTAYILARNYQMLPF